MYVCGYLWEWLLSLHASSARKKIYHLNISGSVVILLQMAPERLACQGWEISHTVACKRLSVNCHRRLSSIFISLSGIGNATKSENPLGNKNQVSLMILVAWPGFMNSDTPLGKRKTRQTRCCHTKLADGYTYWVKTKSNSESKKIQPPIHYQ